MTHLKFASAAFLTLRGAVAGPAMLIGAIMTVACSGRTDPEHVGGIGGAGGTGGSDGGTGGPETKSDPHAAASEAVPALVLGEVAGVLPIENRTQCRPLGFPATELVSAIFSPLDLISEMATPLSDSECLHDQLIEAAADSWATVAYVVLCQGGGDVKLCGAVTTRLCSAEQLMQWDDLRSSPVSARDRTFGFDYAVASQDEPARVALYDRTRQEIRILLDEIGRVANDDASGLRSCPDENAQDIAAAYARATEMMRVLDGV